jgi:hypothetical protein
MRCLRCSSSWSCTKRAPVIDSIGWQVEIADAAKVKGLAPLACKTDRIDAWVLAELSRRELVPPIWLPDRSVRAERERARFRLHLVRHRSRLRAAADHGPRDRLGARLHDRRRDRRHPPLRLTHQAGRLHRALPARLPIRRERPARPAQQNGPATCAGR